MRRLGASQIKTAIACGARVYFAECRGRIEPFVAEHFSYPGAWRTNRKAFGLDLLRAPLNLFWAPVYVLIRLLAIFCQRGGLVWLANGLERAPGGLNTRVQFHLAQVTCSQLLLRPTHEQKKDRLHECIVEAVNEVVDLPADHQQVTAGIDAAIEDALKQYSLTRTATSDISNSLFATLMGAFAFQKFTPGGFAAGILLAALVANELAAQEFLFGEQLGQYYYSVFPATPSLLVSLGSIAATMGVLAVFASLSGLITDPIQARLGLHKRRLAKMIDDLEQDFEEKTLGSFRPKDQYLARLLDLIDAARTSLS